jgi:uncharacterized YccA/Bax inhibitor family protein
MTGPNGRIAEESRGYLGAEGRKAPPTPKRTPGEESMANPALTEKKFEEVRDEDPGWAAPATAAGLATSTSTSTAAAGGVSVPAPGTKVMTANGTFAKTFVLFLFVLAGGAYGWSQVTPSPAGQQVQFPGWIWLPMLAALGCAFACIFRPKLSPFLGPVYAVLEGIALGAISKLFELTWNGIVFQAVLATVGVFFITLALYVFGVVKVTKKFQAVVIAATLGIFVLYFFGAILSLFGVDVMFWNDPSPLGIVISIVICCVAALNLFLDYEFIRQATVAGAPKYMEWYGAFGIMVTLVWLYLEFLRLLSLLRQ